MLSASHDKEAMLRCCILSASLCVLPAHTQDKVCRTMTAPAPAQLRQYSCACAAPTLDAAGSPVQILSGSSILFPSRQALATCTNPGDDGCYAYIVFNNIAGEHLALRAPPWQGGQHRSCSCCWQIHVTCSTAATAD
jgi:hypothetical protein